MLPGNSRVSCGPSLSQCPTVYLLRLWKKKHYSHTPSYSGKIRRNIIHDLNLPDNIGNVTTDHSLSLLSNCCYACNDSCSRMAHMEFTTISATDLPLPSLQSNTRHSFFSSQMPNLASYLQAAPHLIVFSQTYLPLYMIYSTCCTSQIDLDSKSSWVVHIITNTTTKFNSFKWRGRATDDESQLS